MIFCYTGIETNLTSDALVVGSRVKFNCFSDLDPQTVTWYRNGSSVASASGSSKEIIIDPVSTDDQEVTYSCIVVSPYGSQERDKSLNVAGEHSKINAVGGLLESNLCYHLQIYSSQQLGNNKHYSPMAQTTPWQ